MKIQISALTCIVVGVALLTMPAYAHAEESHPIDRIHASYTPYEVLDSADEGSLTTIR